MSLALRQQLLLPLCLNRTQLSMHCQLDRAFSPSVTHRSAVMSVSIKHRKDFCKLEAGGSPLMIRMHNYCRFRTAGIRQICPMVLTHSSANLTDTIANTTYTSNTDRKSTR